MVWEYARCFSLFTIRSCTTIALSIILAFVKAYDRSKTCVFGYRYL